MFTSAGQPVRMHQVTLDEFNDWLILEYEAPDVMVVEDYRIRPKGMTGGWQHEWDKGDTLRIIGKLELYAQMNQVKFVLQDPSIKALANQLVFGKKYDKKSKDPMRHAKDALLHARWYMHKNGLYRA